MTKLEKERKRIESDDRIRDLEHAVADAEEAVSLGASVRPPGMPPGERWEPSVLMKRNANGDPLKHWFAGRVETVDANGVHLVFATTDGDERARRVLRKTLPHDEWLRASRIAPDLAEGLFVEIGEYGDCIQIERVSDFGRPADRVPDIGDLERWAR